MSTADCLTRVPGPKPQCMRKGKPKKVSGTPYPHTIWDEPEKQPGSSHTTTAQKQVARQVKSKYGTDRKQSQIVAEAKIASVRKYEPVVKGEFIPSKCPVAPDKGHTIRGMAASGSDPFAK